MNADKNGAYQPFRRSGGQGPLTSLHRLFLADPEIPSGLYLRLRWIHILVAKAGRELAVGRYIWVVCIK